MIQITLREAIEAQAALQQLSAISFPARLSWRIGRIKREVDKEVAEAETLRVAKIESYACVAEQGGFQVPPENLKEFQEEMECLFDVEVEVWGEQIKIEELGEREIPGSVFASCSWLFSDGDDQAVRAVEAEVVACSYQSDGY